MCVCVFAEDDGNGIGQEHTLILMGIGMVACLVVGVQLGRCFEAHSDSDNWPDVLNWMLQKNKDRSGARRRSSSQAGQRVRLLQQDKHYFTFDNSMVETADL